MGQAAGIRTPQGSLGLGRGVQATTEEMGTHSWAGSEGCHLGALARLGIDAMGRSDPRLGWGGGCHSEARGWLGVSVLGEP